MSLFEILVVVILGIFTLNGLYFSITGRILDKKYRKDDIARADKSLEWEEQIKVLTKRMGELASENHMVVEDNRKWKIAYNELLAKYDGLKKKEETEES